MSFPFNTRTCLLLLTLICVIAFFPSLSNQFTNWDDPEFIIEHPLVQTLSWENVVTTFTTRFQGVYLPLTVLSFAIEHHFFGFNPFIYHLDNLILHIVNAGLVLLIIQALTKNLTIAFLTALLFAISPLRVESVAWVTERKDVLFAFFSLASIYAYIRGYFWPAFGLFVFACLAKHQAILLPFLLILADYWFKRREGIWLWIKKWPFFLVSSIGLWIIIDGVMHIFTNIGHHNLYEKILLTSYVIVVYVQKLLIPYPLSCLYPYPAMINGWFPWLVYVSPLLLLAWLIAAIKLYRRHPVVMIGSAFFIINLLLSLTNVSSGGSILNDRYTYLPSIGLYWIAATWITHLLTKNAKVMIISMVSLYVLVTGFICYERCKVWFDGVTLWSDTIRQYPQIAFIYENRGHAYLDKGQIDLALKDFDQAIVLNPGFASAYNSRAILNDQLGNSDLALKDFNQAISEEPLFANTYFNRAIFYAKQGKVKEAYLDALKAQRLGIAVPLSFIHQLEKAQ